MYLTRLELQGFKTFAKKTVIEFPAPKAGKNPLTVIVGPNGSGKSNLADAMRWVLGEQSMKLLRGKKTEDVIFSGSKGKGRSGFAEVSLTLNNEDKTLAVDYTEVTITRRLYRDGESNYLLNGKKARLADVHLLLAEAGIGRQSYSVIGQGMIDHVLTSSPEERKVFFDDATGVRGFQMKRHSSMLKLKKATENLMEVEMLLGEIEPRLRSLKRQVRRLEQREGVEQELKELQYGYYGTVWWQLQDDLARVQEKRDAISGQVKTKKDELQAGDEALEKMEQESSKDEDEAGEKRKAAHEAYKLAQQALNKARQAQFQAERELELAKVRSQSNWSPLPLGEIIGQLTTITDRQKSALKALKGVKDVNALAPVAKEIEDIFSASTKLKGRLTRPNPEDFKPDPKQLKAIEEAKGAVQSAQDALKKKEQELENVNTSTKSETKSELFAAQRRLRAIQGELHALETKMNQLNIDQARIETRIEGIEREMREEIPLHQENIRKDRPETYLEQLDETRSRMLQLKHKLELIGAIDEETIQEYEQTKERFEFLSGQVTDIQEAIKSTEHVIDELDVKIKSQSSKAFKTINEEFKKYFRVLFNGGSCSLVKVKEGDSANETKVTLDRAMDELAEEKVDEESIESIVNRVRKRKDAIRGIEIQATPPGKKLKSLNLLSGGERALTSIALVSAIMATNPSPFVVLDEVDAALDESNTMRFANILDELRGLSQFIVVTHNRATMERADLLYGVTMGDDGISNLISVSMEDIEEAGSARR